jgi:hypothetical protein
MNLRLLAGIVFGLCLLAALMLLLGFGELGWFE